MSIEDLITYIIVILIAVVIFAIFNWLLPFIAILLIAYVIYRYIQEKKD